MRKIEKTTFQWPKVSRLLTTLTRQRPEFRTGLRFSFRASKGPVLRVRKSHFQWFSSLQKSFAKEEGIHQKCIRQNLFTAVTWFQIWLWFIYLFVCTSRFANFARGKWSNYDYKNCSEIRGVRWSVIRLWKLQFSILIFFTPLYCQVSISVRACCVKVENLPRSKFT